MSAPCLVVRGAPWGVAPRARVPPGNHPERRRLGIEQLPETLGEAIELTAESELVLRTLGEHMFNRFIEIKRQEWDDYRVQVTPWELDRYLGIL